MRFFTIIILLTGASLCNKLAAQDTLYTTTGILYNVKVRDNQPGFVEYRLPDELINQNFFIDKQQVNIIKWKGGFIENIIHDSPAASHSVFSFIDSSGAILKENTAYNPAVDFPVDSTIKLYHFKDDKFYLRRYGYYPHFHINDPEKKLLNCRTITFTGVDFSCMKLTNDHDRMKAHVIKHKYLKNVAANLNNNPDLIMYPNTFLKGKQMILDTKASVNSYKKLDAMSWIGSNEYTLPVGKIPAILRSFKYEQKEGLGIVFIIEKFSKPEKTISGYWVVFDFNNCDVLLIDFVNFGKVSLQTNFAASGWDGYWEAGALDAGVLDPMSFQYYLEQEKKGKFEFSDK